MLIRNPHPVPHASLSVGQERGRRRQRVGEGVLESTFLDPTCWEAWLLTTLLSPTEPPRDASRGAYQ